MPFYQFQGAFWRQNKVAHSGFRTVIVYHFAVFTIPGSQKHPRITKNPPKNAKFHWFLGEIHQNLGEIHWDFGDFWWFWGASGSPEWWKCKMTHYYCAKTTLGHLILPPKSTPELVKWHQKSTQKCQIPLIFRWNSPKFRWNSPKFWWFLVILGCFWEPRMVKSAKWHTITVRKPLWATLFCLQKAPRNW